MKEPTPRRPFTERVSGLLHKIDQRIFRDGDLLAIANDWEIEARLFRRTYRDRRWNRSSTVPSTSGSRQ